jgi:anaerobic selenocysteine-containing dehydrogenase
VQKAVAPPGEAKSDFEILLDYAHRMDFRDKDEKPLVKWETTEQCFEAWKACTRGRPCDYSGLSYEKLSRGSGIQWPCNDANPEGCERLYSDGRFNTDADYCELYGHDLTTGAAISEETYRTQNPRGRAIIKAAEYRPPPESPDAEYPMLLTTGRIVYHWHTRTRTGRVQALQQNAPEPFGQIAPSDAAGLGITEGDFIKIISRRGEIQVRARIGDIEPGHIFVPFHYGYWDSPERLRAANELTLTGWDPISKQPHFKYAAVRITKA